MEPTGIGATALTLLVGTPAITFIGAAGAAVAVGLPRGGVLVSVLVLPLAIPVLIFGVSASYAAVNEPDPFLPPFLILCRTDAVSRRDRPGRGGAGAALFGRLADLAIARCRCGVAARLRQTLAGLYAAAANEGTDNDGACALCDSRLRHFGAGASPALIAWVLLDQRARRREMAELEAERHAPPLRPQGRAVMAAEADDRQKPRRSHRAAAAGAVPGAGGAVPDAACCRGATSPRYRRR